MSCHYLIVLIKPLLASPDVSQFSFPFQRISLEPIFVLSIFPKIKEISLAALHPISTELQAPLKEREEQTPSWHSVHSNYCIVIAAAFVNRAKLNAK